MLSASSGRSAHHGWTNQTCCIQMENHGLLQLRVNLSLQAKVNAEIATLLWMGPMGKPTQAVVIIQDETVADLWYVSVMNSELSTSGNLNIVKRCNINKRLKGKEIHLKTYHCKNVLLKVRSPLCGSFVFIQSHGSHDHSLVWINLHGVLGKSQHGCRRKACSYRAPQLLFYIWYKRRTQ